MDLWRDDKVNEISDTKESYALDALDCPQCAELDDSCDFHAGVDYGIWIAIQKIKTALEME